MEKETLKHYEAFEKYYAMGEHRTLKALSDQLEVNVSTTEKWSKEFGWADRVILRDKANAEKLADKTDTQIINEKSKLINIVKASIAVYVDKLKKGNQVLYDKDGKPVEVPGIEIKRPRDLDVLVRLYMELMGEVPDEIQTIMLIDSKGADAGSKSDEDIPVDTGSDSQD